MRRIRWTGVVLGAVITVLLAGTLLYFVVSVLEPHVSVITGTAPVNGVTSVSVAEERMHGLIMLLSAISAILLAFFAGGLVSGRFVSSYAGFDAAVMGTFIVAIPFTLLLATILLVLLEPARGVGDAYTQSESLRMSLAALIICSFISPVAVLTGFLGGRIGDRLGR